MVKGKKIKQKRCLSCKAKSPLFSLLSDEELDLIDENRLEVSFKAGEVIRKQGTFLSHVISINSGLCKIYFDNINQQNIILRIIKPTSFIGGPGLYVDQKSHYSVAAIADSTVCFIAVDVFKQIMHTNNAFADEFIKDMSKNILINYNRLMNLTQKQMSGRIADALRRAEQERRESLAMSSGAGVEPVAAASTPCAQALANTPPASPQKEQTEEQQVELVEGLSESLVPFYEHSSLVTEQYRSLRTRLLSQNPHYEHKVIAITSAVPKEGKSVTTLNLAIVMAKARSQAIRP